MGDDRARRLILGRRARFIASTLASVAATAATGVAIDACGGEVDPDPTEQADAGSYDGATPQPCLTPAMNDDAGAGVDGSPQPCLKVAPDAGKDAGPRPCLVPPLPDGG